LPKTFSFGKNGKPFFMSGPNDSRTRIRNIMDKLVKSISLDGFDYIVNVDGLRDGHASNPVSTLIHTTSRWSVAPLEQDDLTASLIERTVICPDADDPAPAISTCWGEALSASPHDSWLPCETREVSAAATGRRRPRRHRPDDPLEIGVRSGIAVDWHMLRDIELQHGDGSQVVRGSPFTCSLDRGKLSAC
jgi:hypothetical protein